MSNGTVPTRDALDDKVNRLFAGKVVRKDLVRKVKVGANVPVFVLEYLLGKYCATDDPAAIDAGMRVVGVCHTVARPAIARVAHRVADRIAEVRVLDLLEA